MKGSTVQPDNHHIQVFPTVQGMTDTLLPTATAGGHVATPTNTSLNAGKDDQRTFFNQIVQWVQNLSHGQLGPYDEIGL